MQVTDVIAIGAARPDKIAREGMQVEYAKGFNKAFIVIVP